MTQMATITVAFRNPPKGNGPASVRDTNGTFWKFWTTGKNPMALETFEEGKTYTVGYTVKPYNGKDEYYITAVAAEGAPAPKPQMNGHAAPTNGNGKYAPTDDKTAERIFVCGGINHAIGAGKLDVFTPDELIQAIESLRAAYQATFGKIPF